MTGCADDAELDLEMAYTPATTACRDLYSPAVWCRRPPGHEDQHVAGHGDHRTRWAR